MQRVNAGNLHHVQQTNAVKRNGGGEEGRNGHQPQEEDGEMQYSSGMGYGGVQEYTQTNGMGGMMIDGRNSSIQAGLNPSQPQPQYPTPSSNSSYKPYGFSTSPRIVHPSSTNGVNGQAQPHPTPTQFPAQPSPTVQNPRQPFSSRSLHRRSLHNSSLSSNGPVKGGGEARGIDSEREDSVPPVHLQSSSLLAYNAQRVPSQTVPETSAPPVSTLNASPHANPPQPPTTNTSSTSTSTSTSAEQATIPRVREGSIEILERPRERSRTQSGGIWQIELEMGGPELKGIVTALLSTIRRLASNGAVAIEAIVEQSKTLPLLRQYYLPTNDISLSEFAPHMSNLLRLPGLAARDYVDTFISWHRFNLHRQFVTFPICGPIVAVYLSSVVEAQDRAKSVYILEQYRKRTVEAFVGLKEILKEQQHKVNGLNFSDEEWEEWDRFVELSQKKLAEWKIIEEMAPPVPISTAPRASTSRSHTPAMAPIGSFAPRQNSLTANPSAKALGKQRADQVEAHAVGASETLIPPHDPSPITVTVKKHRSRRRRLPAADDRADKEFFVAISSLEQAMWELGRVQEAEARDSNKPGEDTTMIAEQTQEPIAPPTLPTFTLPFADYTPSLALAQGFVPSVVTAPAIGLPRTLPSSFPFFPHPPSATSTSTFTPSMTSTPLLPVSTSAPPMFTFTPQHFLSYPKSLVPNHRLPERLQTKTWNYARCLEREREIRGSVGEEDKKMRLMKLVKGAMVEGRPLTDLSIDGEGDERRGEPIAARIARERARREGVEPVYERGGNVVVAEGEEDMRTAKSVTSSPVRALRGVPVATSSEGGSDCSDNSDRRGKRREEGESMETVSKSRKLVSTMNDVSVSPSSVSTLTRSAPVPIVSISTPDSPPSPPSGSAPLTSSSLHARRPSMSSSAASAPVVPQRSRSRSKSVSQEPPKMSRRTSIGAVHPLASFYAGQSPQYREGVRLKAAELVKASKSASPAIAAAAQSPLIVAKALASVPGLRPSPRLGLRALPSPPLVPIPLPSNIAGSPNRGTKEQSNDAMDIDESPSSQNGGSEKRLETLQPSSISSEGSALGVILELPSPQPQPATSAASTSSEPTNKSPPIPTPAHSPARKAQPEHPPYSEPFPQPRTGEAPSQPQAQVSTSTTEPCADPAKTESSFSRLVNKISSGFGRLVGSSPERPPSSSIQGDEVVSPVQQASTDLPHSHPNTHDERLPPPYPSTSSGTHSAPESTHPTSSSTVDPSERIEQESIAYSNLSKQVEATKMKDSSPSIQEAVGREDGDRDEEMNDRMSSVEAVERELGIVGRKGTKEKKKRPIDQVDRGSSRSKSPLATIATTTTISNGRPRTSSPLVPGGGSSTISRVDKGKSKAVQVVVKTNLNPSNNGATTTTATSTTTTTTAWISPTTGKVLKDHPLRHLSKRVLSASEPVMPFGKRSR